MDDDVFNYRDFSKIPLYMQNATLYDIRKYGVDDDFHTTLESRIEKYAFYYKFSYIIFLYVQQHTYINTYIHTYMFVYGV